MRWPEPIAVDESRLRLAQPDMLNGRRFDGKTDGRMLTGFVPGVKIAGDGVAVRKPRQGRHNLASGASRWWSAEYQKAPEGRHRSVESMKKSPRVWRYLEKVHGDLMPARTMSPLRATP